MDQVQMDVDVPMTRGTNNSGRRMFPSALNVHDSDARITLLAMAEIHIRQTAWGGNVWYNVVTNIMHHHRHD